jgi:hypothetical protein
MFPKYPFHPSLIVQEKPSQSLRVLEFRANLDQSLSIHQSYLTPPQPGNGNTQFQGWCDTFTSFIGSIQEAAERASDSAMEMEDGEEREIRMLEWKSPIESLDAYRRLPDPKPSIAHLKVYQLVDKLPNVHKTRLNRWTRTRAGRTTNLANFSFSPRRTHHKREGK